MWWKGNGGDSLGSDQRTVERRGQQGEEGKSQGGTGSGRGRGVKTVVEHQHSRKFEFTLVGRWDVKREEGNETTEITGRVLWPQSHQTLISVYGNNQ